MAFDCRKTGKILPGIVRLQHSYSSRCPPRACRGIVGGFRQKSPCEKRPVFGFCSRTPTCSVCSDVAKGTGDSGFHAIESGKEGMPDIERTRVSDGDTDAQLTMIPRIPASDPKYTARPPSPSGALRPQTVPTFPIVKLLKNIQKTDQNLMWGRGVGRCTLVNRDHERYGKPQKF